MKGLPAMTGLAWLKQGFTLFRQQPGILMMIIFGNLLAFMMLSMVPVLGSVIGFLAIPSFTMAIQQSCRLIDEGQRVHPRVLLTGFQKESIGPLFKLGGVYLGMFLLMILVVLPWIDTASMDAARKMMQAKQDPVVDRQTALALLVLTLLLSLGALALSFAPGLTYWKRMPTFKAIFYSVFAIIGSAAPMAVMVITWLGAYMLGKMMISTVFGNSSVVQVILTWLTFIAVLVFHCAMYAAYKQILGAPEEDPAPVKPL